MSTENSVANILVVAGEASSDGHAAELVHHIKERMPSAVVWGMGGSAMRAEGVETVVDCETSGSVMGFFELFGSLGAIIASFKLLVKEAKKRKPDLLILVDYPDFNLRLAKALSPLGVKTFYFITPQVWAWRTGRVETIKRYIDKVAAIFPFEEKFFKRRGVDAEFVGHPFIEREPVSIERNSFLESIGVNPQQKVVALLPGSRRSEVSRLLKPMAEAVRLLKKDNPDLQAVLPIAPGLSENAVRSELANDDGIVLVKGKSREILAVADAAVVASGTATVEAALARIPFLVVYKLSPLTYPIAKLLIKGVSDVAMANLILEERVVEELIQDEVTGQRIAKELQTLLEDDVVRASMIKRLSEVEAKLHSKRAHGVGPAKRAAELAVELLETSDSSTNNPLQTSVSG